MNFTYCDSEEERWLDVALKHCVDLNRMLLLSLLKVEMLKCKCKTSGGSTDDSSMQNAVAVSSLRKYLTPLDETAMEVDSLGQRTLRNIWDTNSNLSVQTMKIRRIVDSVVRRVDYLLLKYRKREYHPNVYSQISPYLPERRCH